MGHQDVYSPVETIEFVVKYVKTNGKEIELEGGFETQQAAQDFCDDFFGGVPSDRLFIIKRKTTVEESWVARISSNEAAK